MTGFATLLDTAAKFAVKQFALSGKVRLFYEDRNTGNRIEIMAISSPVEIEYGEGANAAKYRKHRTFLIDRNQRDLIHAFRADLHDSEEYKSKIGDTPGRLDYIVMENDGTQKRYQIHKDRPFSVIGPNEALTRIYTTLDKTIPAE